MPSTLARSYLVMYGVVERWSAGTACPSGSFSERELREVSE